MTGSTHTPNDKHVSTKLLHNWGLKQFTPFKIDVSKMYKYSSQSNSTREETMSRSISNQKQNLQIFQPHHHPLSFEKKKKKTKTLAHPVHAPPPSCRCSALSSSSSSPRPSIVSRHSLRRLPPSARILC